MDLREALIRDFSSGFDKHAEQVLNNHFINNKDSWVKSVAEDYIKYDIDPNVSLTKLAEDHSLNSEQVKRLVEETNVSIYLQKYASLRGDAVRDVNFTLADANKISVKFNEEVVSDADMVTVASAGTDGIDKVASYTGGATEKVNFLNSYSDYEPSLWGDTIDKNASNLMLRKVRAAVAEEAVNKISHEQSVINKIASISNAVLRYELLCGEGQELLDKIAADAGWYGGYQTPVLRYLDRTVDLYKEAKRLPPSFEPAVSYSSSVEDNPYSLRNHSLLEKTSAEIVVNVDRMPENVNYDDLVVFAKELKHEINSNVPRKGVRTLHVSGADTPEEISEQVREKLVDIGRN